MEEFLSLFNQYARSELMILVPVLIIINKVIDMSKIKSNLIPIITTLISVVLCALYTFSAVPILGFKTALLALFTSVTQGILFAGTSVFAGIVISPDCISNILKKNTNQPNPKK